jgi:hypothetical protein
MAADARRDVAGRPQSLRNCTEAADYAKLWDDLRESISFVEGGKSQPWTRHLLSAPTTQVIMSQSYDPLTLQTETDALCKNTSATRTHSFLSGHVRDSFQDGFIGRLLREVLQRQDSPGGW